MKNPNSFTRYLSSQIGIFWLQAGLPPSDPLLHSLLLLLFSFSSFWPSKTTQKTCSQNLKTSPVKSLSSLMFFYMLLLYPSYAYSALPKKTFWIFSRNPPASPSLWSFSTSPPKLFNSPKNPAYVFFPTVSFSLSHQKFFFFS